MNKLNFDIPFSGFSNLDFINVLASTLLYLEGVHTAETDYDCAKQSTGQCSGCRNCHNTLPATQEKTYFLLDTMCGRSSLRCRFDGTPTEMQRWIGETAADDCGTDATVDFLFGYIGYDYRMVTGTSVFASEIRNSLDRNRPVIARVGGSHGLYRVIIGQDGSALLEPSYAAAQNLPRQPVTYGDLEALYLIGEKIPRRFTEKDGLVRIVKVMEYNAAAGLWEEYEQKMGWYGGMDGTSVEEHAARMKRTADTMWHTFNSHNFAEVFRYRCSDELKAPAIDELQQNMNTYGYTHDLAWSLIGMNDIIKWDGQHGGIIIGYAEAIQLILHQIRENDKMVLDIVKRTLKRL